MWRSLSRVTTRQRLYLLGRAENTSRWPPHRCRHEWQENEYSDSSEALTMRTSVPSPIPNRPSKRNARMASHHKNARMGRDSQKKYRWMFWRTKGKRVSPMYRLGQSRTAQPGGDPKNDR